MTPNQSVYVLMKRLAVTTGIFLLVVRLCHSSTNDSISNKDYRETTEKNFSLISENPSLMVYTDEDNISYIQTGIGFRHGGLSDYYEGDKGFNALIEAKSLYRLNKKTFVSGVVSYNTDKGYNMYGSVFSDPTYLPFNIVETVDDKGTKKKELYRIGGNIGYLFYDKWSLGLGIDYISGNYAKYKDLRHQNSIMKFKSLCGLSYEINDIIKIGLSYKYIREIESLFFKIYGNTDKIYHSLIDFGAFYGRKELFGESGYTHDTTPLYQETHGIGIQSVIDLDKNVFYNELKMAKINGRFGTGSDTDVNYTRHNGMIFSINSRSTIDKGEIFHVLDIDADYISMENSENAFKESTDEYGVSKILYYGSNKVGDKSWMDLNLAYKLFKGKTSCRSDWSLGVSSSFRQRHTNTILYPYYREQKINVFSFGVLGSRAKCLGKNILSLSPLLAYSFGWGQPSDDGVYSTKENIKTETSTNDNLLEREFDYQTAKTLNIGMSFIYERILNRHISIYSDFGINVKRAFSTSLNGKYNTNGTFNIGVKF